MNLYSVKDSASGEFAPVFSAVNDLVAVRMFRTMMSKVPPVAVPDFLLFRVGRFDQDKGFVFGLVDQDNLDYPYKVKIPELPVKEDLNASTV